MSATLDRRISLHKLEVFCLVVDLGGVGRAAERLFVAQPVVTAHLRSLQDRLGAELLQRDRNGLRMTESGERVYAWATELLATSRELARELDTLVEGTGGAIVVASSASMGSYVLPELLSDFRRARPETEITLELARPQQVVAAVRAAEADMGVVVADPHPDATGLAVEQVGREQVVLVRAPASAPDVASVPLAALESLPLVASSCEHFRHAVVDRQLRRAGVEPRNVTIALGHPEAIKRAVHEGLGLALLFRSAAAPELASGALLEVTIEDARLSAPVFIVRRADSRLTPAQEHVLDALRERLRRQLEQGGEQGPAEHPV